MSKKIFGGKKKKAADPVADAKAATTNLPQPIIAALSPDEVKKRKLLRGPSSTGAAANVLGYSPGGTLGG